MYSFDYRLYRRDFQTPLQTHHGIWKTREGIIIRLTDERGEIGWGEIAPLPLFGSETLEMASAFCVSLGKVITPQILSSIADELPATQFAFESAIESLTLPDFNITSSLYSYLLPSGVAALESLPKALSHRDINTLKWKIGVSPPDKELKIWRELMAASPPEIKIRLDANGGLNLQTAETWLKNTDESPRVEFIEQPLGVDRFREMLRLSLDYKTPIALDESVATLTQLEDIYQKGWRGIFVVKPCIMGFPSRFRKLCRQYQLDVVLSSVLETEIGRRSALRLVGWGRVDRSLGFGVNQWFAANEPDWLDNLWQTSSPI
ncbi:MAG: o-succinylbenzoate synthase [Chroococcopsis gigantea SAG 12.99]|jgi:O-succinylbenzoate synthase|nr:o-succinylbenzoate synthase [Chlorogloea purpurea SAG 13.99]MDV3000284.1 o-succinylbenzoate synthase [Chroococcopsis gigantea SAG 12.99]